MRATGWDAFLSYGTADLRLAESLCDELTARGLRVFLAPRALEPGGSFPTQLETAIEQSRTLLCLLSSASASSPWVERELVAAVALDVPIVACRIDDAALPRSINFLVRVTQHARIHDPLTREDVERLVGSLLSKREPFEAKLLRYARNVQAWQPAVQARAQRLALAAKIDAEAEAEPLAKLFAKQPRIALTGSPGSGKSTFLLQTLGQQCARLEQALVASGPIDRATVPVYIELGSLATEDATAASIQHRICTVIMRQLDLADSGRAPELFAELLAQCPVTLLLDGLNELPRAQQESCARALFGLTHELAAKGLQARLRIAISSRTYSFVNYFAAQSYVVAEIVPLTPDEIQIEIRRRLGVTAAEAAKIFSDLNVRFRQFVANPQHLQYVLDWLADQRDLGLWTARAVRSRGKLFEHCIERRLRMTADDKQLARAILQALGYRTSRDGAFFPTKEVLALAREIAEAHGSSEGEIAVVESLFELGILVRSRDKTRFGHHSMQQYFAAVEMKERWALEEYVQHEALHECLVIMAGLLDAQQLDALLRETRGDRRLTAYILANVDAPERERAFVDQSVTSFKALTQRWIVQIGRFMKVRLALWLLLLPIPSLYLMADTPGVVSPWLRGLLLFIAAGAFSFPVVILQIGRGESDRLRTRLVDAELPSLIASLRYLMADGAMRIVLNHLRGLQSKVPFERTEPRRVFVDSVIRTLERALSSSKFLSEDEMLDQLGDPLVAALVDPAKLSAAGVVKLIEKSKSRDEREALQALAILRQLYVQHPEHQPLIARRLVEAAHSGGWQSKRRRAAQQACEGLRLTVPARASLFVRILRSLLRLLAPRGRA